MPIQFLLNLLIALLWVFLNDESTFEIPTFISGFLIGIGIIFMLHRFFGTPFYLKRVLSMIKLLAIFNYELITSSLLIMKQILTHSKEVEPGIFTYKTELDNDWHITALALLLMLTPGSVVLRVSPEGDTFYIHAMDIKESKPSVLKSIRLYEKVILEVARP
ncbi:Na+/H+ antiporter subunit E [Jeotgalibacillus proteolyticus]|uniref:Na+/H+ antiporter subunit E n=1 Tax=Jeotgalibacillus proteolyticus TaxID=2082395 RepID=A0A2S5G9M8_9BACL|nr:Na+/H+ antiporter subunit E [Jeotgalibacillus proteolyticus]PPA69717.1 Na+/H+ antiporter subunit E [Jeotgalibacillus proteolyticus]